MSDLVERLRGVYRVPITDGLGPAGGEEPENPNEFVRTFPATPIQQEAAREIERLRAVNAELVEALENILGWRETLGDCPDHLPEAVHVIKGVEDLARAALSKAEGQNDG